MITGSDEMNSERLGISKLNSDDHGFIFRLVNTPGWLRFIGDRNVRTEDDAKAYIEKIAGNPEVQYWTVRLKDDQAAIGIVTLIKRTYLEHHDIGFAFLEAYSGKGYAAEAVKTVLRHISGVVHVDKLLAITSEENMRSVQLLEKLNFHYETTVTADGKTWSQYALGADAIAIEKITRSFFNAFSNIYQAPDFGRLYDICADGVQIVKQCGEHTEVYTLPAFIEPRRKILTDGTLTAFHEYETAGTTEIKGEIALRRSRYHKKGMLHGEAYEGGGHKFFHFVKNGDAWKIIHVLWSDEV